MIVTFGGQNQSSQDNQNCLYLYPGPLPDLFAKRKRVKSQHVSKAAFVIVHHMCVTAQCSFNFPSKLSIGISCNYPRDPKIMMGLGIWCICGEIDRPAIIE